MGYSSAEVRRFLLESFSDEEIEVFCFDHFPDARQELSASMSKGEKVAHMLEYIQQRGLIRKLFTALQIERPDQFNTRFGDTLPENLEQLFMTVEQGESPARSLQTYAAYTERVENMHSQAIRSRRRNMIIVAALGLSVAAFSQVPYGLPVLQTLRTALVIAGFFVCSLSAFQWIDVNRHQRKVELCENARLMLVTIGEAYQSGDVSAGSRLEQILQQVMGKISEG